MRVESIGKSETIDGLYRLKDHGSKEGKKTLMSGLCKTSRHQSRVEGSIVSEDGWDRDVRGLVVMAEG